MGCASSSAVSPELEKQPKDLKKQTNILKIKQEVMTKNHSNRNIKSAKSKIDSLNFKNQQFDNNGNKLNPLTQTPVPKSVAFDVTLDGHTGEGLISIKRRPPRLQTLEPLNVPRLTTEQLQEKQRLADEKRERLKQRKINTSQKMSRRMRELNKAREFEMSHLIKEDSQDKMDNMKQAELKREQHLLAKQAHSPNVDTEIEKYEEFNNASDDTWLGIPDKTNRFDIEEYGLQKRAGQIRQTVSSTTIDNYDAAFMRNTTEQQNLQPVHNLHSNIHMSDDFFYS